MQDPDTWPIELPEYELSKILANKDTFSAATKVFKVPWELVGALWYRTGANTVSSSRGGGHFGFNKPINKRTYAATLKKYTTFNITNINRQVALPLDTLIRSSILASALLARMEGRTPQERLIEFSSLVWPKLSEAFAMNGYSPDYYLMNRPILAYGLNDRLVYTQDTELGAYPIYLQLRAYEKKHKTSEDTGEKS